MKERSLRYDCDCDAVLAMEEMGVSVEEILQHARAILTRRQVRSLLRGLESILERPARPCPVAGEPEARTMQLTDSWR